MAIKWYVVFVLALVIIQAKARDMPTKKEAITDADVATNGHVDTNTVNVGPTNKNNVPRGKGPVKDKKCGLIFSGIGGWGAMSGFIPLTASKANGAAAPGKVILP